MGKGFNYMRKKQDYRYFAVLLIFIVFGVFVLGVYYGEKIGSLNYEEQVRDLTNEIIEYNMKLNYTWQVYDKCSVLENMGEKFTCVGNFVVENYNYVFREDIYSIDDLFDLGADCKSYSVYYATLAKMMDYDYIFIKTDDHMFVIVYLMRK